MGGLSAILKLTNAAEDSTEMNNAMLAKEWREAPLSRTTDIRANARPWPVCLVKPWLSSIEYALVVVADCVTTVANSRSYGRPLF